MIKNGEYEGLITIRDVPSNISRELIGLTRNYCTQAQTKDPMDRLISIKREPKEITIKTTENQLAHKLARHIVRTYKGAKDRTTYGKNAHMLARIEITFPKTA